MSMQLGSADPSWDCGDFSQEFLRAIATFAKNNGITGQAQWTAFVASVSTLPQAVAVCKGLLGLAKCNAP